MKTNLKSPNPNQSPIQDETKLKSQIKSLFQFQSLTERGTKCDTNFRAPLALLGIINHKMLLFLTIHPHLFFPTFRFTFFNGLDKKKKTTMKKGNDELVTGVKLTPFALCKWLKQYLAFLVVSLLRFAGSVH